MSHIRILCFNIHGGRSLDGVRDLKRVNGLMERLDIDIAVLQEMETRASRKASLDDIERVAGKDRPHHLAGVTIREGEGWYGNLIVSRFPILKGRVHNLDTDKGFEPRNAVDAVIQTPCGNLCIIGTHLSLSYLQRMPEAERLLHLAKAADEEAEATHVPLLLMGDINEWQPWSKLLRFLDANMQPVPCRATFPSLLPLLRLDRVWHETPCTIRVTAHRLPAKGLRMMSDHLPLLVEVHF